ncbi:G-type lectin S-receptor-like serine/threonine-protein kinase [Apostasia shenzhenica]|uniref:Receptor-like serine/threonine-protein kinase n=1 Tax=Apostasia shenzhenica TaxID=1088818 RepID=A0A2I0ASJ4_9ASPA|nr:G-type lectin S-receptor-like serine/threonine-protein kinase [Apostasia shenzhenica]
MKPLTLFVSSLLIIGNLIAGRSAAGIPLGSVLRPTNSSTWSSPNNTFSVSFVSEAGNPSLFLAVISYDGGVPTWTAGAIDSGGFLELLLNGNLLLSNGSGTAVWESGTADRGISAAFLDELGNLKLTMGDSSVVWQSFDNPTDTIVESQSFGFGKVLRSGPYSFTVLNTGNLTLIWNNSITYFNKGLNSSFNSNHTLDSPTITLQSNGILTLFDDSLPSSVSLAFSSDFGESGDMLRFIRLDRDGNLRAYSVLRGVGGAVDRWSAISDQCQVFGWCGNMGICSYNDSSPVCACPSENFELVDPNDSTMGCKRKTDIQNCVGNSTMLQLDNTQFLTYPPDISTEQFFVGITACRLNCLSGGSCVASTSLADGSGLCYLKVSSFVSGYKSPSLPSTSFVKVCAPATPNPPLSFRPSPKSSVSSKTKAWVLAVVVLGTIMALVMIESGLWWFFCRRNPKFRPSSAQHAFLEYASCALMQFSYKELHSSTKCFREKLGAGGFGAVYKGFLPNGTIVAVKQLEGIEQGEKQFRIEVATISRTHHMNLVRLIGFCSEGSRRLLVYEFMKNGSLDRYLFSEKSETLSWATRCKIAIGTAKGITYLHEECRDCIVHCDIKPENILLDDNYNVKVSDFGLAKMITAEDNGHQNFISVCGTRGYLAPEWLSNQPVTLNSDVYSFGLVLLEIIGGRRNFDVLETGRAFSRWAYEEFEKGNFIGIIDKRLQSSDVDLEQLERLVQVSFWCIQEQPAMRPSMSKVVQMLEGFVEIERPQDPKRINSSLDAASRNKRISAHSNNDTSAVNPSSGSFEDNSTNFSGFCCKMEQVSSSLHAA